MSILCVLIELSFLKIQPIPENWDIIVASFFFLAFGIYTRCLVYRSAKNTYTYECLLFCIVHEMFHIFVGVSQVVQAT